MRSVYVDARSTANQSVEVVVPFEIDGVIDQKCLQIPDLMVGNILEIH